ncbi:hypothetical protein Tco_0333413 [Tanacetum coccineum]
MVFVDHTGWKLHKKQWTGTTDQFIEDLEAAYDNAPNMFSVRIHHGGKFQRYPGRMYVSGHVDIFDMVDIDLFTVVALNLIVLKLGYTGKSEPMFYNYLRPLTSLDEGLYALACEEDVCYLATFVRSFKLIEVYIEHGVTSLDSYLRAPRFRATLEEITDEPGSIATNIIEKMLLLTWHESSETSKEPVCDSVIPSSFPQHDLSTPCKDSVCESITSRCMPDCILTPPTNESVIRYTQLSGVEGVDTQSHVIDDMIRQLSFDEIELDREVGSADVAGSGMDSSDVGRTQEPILAEVSTQEPIVAKSSTQEPMWQRLALRYPLWKRLELRNSGNGQEDESAPTDGQFFYDNKGIDTTYETEYDVQSSEDAGIDDDDDVDEDFLVDEENEIIEPDVDVHLFGISMDLPFDNIGVTNLVSDDVLEGEDVDVINADGFDSDPGNDEEKNYRKRRLAELRTEMEGVINASGQWKYSFYTGQKFTTPKEAKDRVYLHSIESRRNLKLYKNDGVRIRARCDGKVPVFTMSQGTRPTGLNRRMEAWPSGSSGPTTRSKKRKNTGTNDDSQASSSVLNAHDKGDLFPWVLYVGKDKFTKKWMVKTYTDTHTCLQSREIKHYTYKFLSEKIFKQVRVNLDIPVKAVQYHLQRELEVRISMSKAFRAKAKAERENRGYHGLPYSMLRDYFVELQSTKLNTTVNIAVERNTDSSLHTRVFQRIYVCLGALKLGFRACRRDLLGLDGMMWQAYKDLLWRAASATNVRDFEKCMLEIKTMNPKAHEWLNKIPAEHWARSHFSVGGRDKPVITLLEYIREYCMKRIVNVQCVIDKCTGSLTLTATRIIESIKKEAHLMKEIGIEKDSLTKYWEKSTCPTTLLPPKHHVQVGRPRKKRKRSKHEDEPFVKDGKLSRKGRTITCQSCGNTRHNKATCKGQGRKASTGGNNAEANGSASRKAQQIKPAVGQDGSGGSGIGVVIGLSATAGEGGASGLGVASQGSSNNRWIKRIVQTERISPQKELPLNLQVNLLPVLKC